MTTSAFFLDATRIEMINRTSIAQTTSQSGVRQAQRRAPVFYDFKVKYPVMRVGGTEHTALHNAIINSNYGASTIYTTVFPTRNSGLQAEPNGSYLITQGSWLGSSNNTFGRNIEVEGSSENGSSILLTGFSTSATNQVAVGDFIGFGRGTHFNKICQITTAVSQADSNNQITVTLNYSIPSGVFPSSQDRRVQVGWRCAFQLAIAKMPQPTYFSNGLVQYSDGFFQEVL